MSSGFINPLRGEGGFINPLAPNRGQGLSEDEVRDLVQKLTQEQQQPIRRAPSFEAYVSQFGTPEYAEDIQKNMPDWNDYDEESRKRFLEDQYAYERAMRERSQAQRTMARNRTAR